MLSILSLLAVAAIWFSKTTSLPKIPIKLLKILHQNEAFTNYQLSMSSTNFKLFYWSAQQPLQFKKKVNKAFAERPKLCCLRGFKQTQAKTRYPRIKSNLHYSRGVTSKRVTRGGIHLRGLAPGQHSSEETSRAVGDVVSDLRGHEAIFSGFSRAVLQT